MFSVLDKSVATLSVLFLWIGKVALVTMMLMTVFSIVSRALTGAAVPDSVAISEAMMVFLVMLPLLAVQRSDDHVRVELLDPKPDSFAARFLAGFGALVCLAAFGIMAWGLGFSALLSLERAEVYRGVMTFPIWPFRLVAAIAVCGLALGFAMSFWGVLRDQKTPTASGRLDSTE